eukprot:CAMPEP_0171467002 /NCGR_PEP_ID=MMETSP0945-20130129/9661_1 /TAXON_ID=109269 /ORGANISM="Vaucheria litorea, Strain CCMP2940" /LENGTH=165 /DNA_ID=CAMNT_0011995335 /DNA_START=191 /DNA_END=688 /DNA_ORIENTATION=+
MQAMCEAMQPFTEAIGFEVGFFESSRTHFYPIKLPVVLSCFIEPVVLSKDEFWQRWQMLSGDQLEEKEVLLAPTPVSSNYLAMLKGRLTKGVRMGLAGGFEGEDAAFNLAGIFKTGTLNQSGNKVSVGVMMTLAFDQQANEISVAVRSGHKKVALAVKNVVKMHL